MSTSHSESSQHVSFGSGDNEVTNTSSGSKRKRSVVWQHFMKVRGINDIVQAKCNHCEKLLSGGVAHGTTRLTKHLKKACPKFKLEFRSGSSRSPVAEFKFDQVKSRKDFAIACIKHKYPFNIGEHEYFELFLNGLNPDFKLPCRNTIRGDVTGVYEEEKVKVYKLLDGLKCKVSLTTDIWTSEHSRIAYSCLTGHFIDDNWELQKKILAFKKIPYPHDSETLFIFMKEMILEWNLEKKISSVVVDNATSNDAMIRKLKDWLICDSIIDFDGDLLHVRCSAHILNLIVQDGLSQIRGLIEKIRETVRYLNKSFTATQKFETALNQCNLEDKRQVAMDVPNRWNSTYEMLATALPLKEAFCRLQRIDKHYLFNPSESEWEVAEVIKDCLQIFYEATRHFSGRKYPTSNVFFPDVCEIHLKLIEWGNSKKDFIKGMSLPMKMKFDKYWDESSLVLSVAVVFDPRFKMDLVEYFHAKIYGENSGPYNQRVRDILVNLFINYGGSFMPSATEIIMESSSSVETSNSLRDFDRWCDASRVTINHKSELDIYLEESRFPRAQTFSILDWWRTNSHRIPILVKIARDILAVPATTIASEAAFSVGGRVIDESRSCLLPDVVEALIVADDWIGSIPRKILNEAESSETRATSIFQL